MLFTSIDDDGELQAAWGQVEDRDDGNGEEEEFEQENEAELESMLPSQ